MRYDRRLSRWIGLDFGLDFGLDWIAVFFSCFANVYSSTYAWVSFRYWYWCLYCRWMHRFLVALCSLIFLPVPYCDHAMT